MFEIQVITYKVHENCTVSQIDRNVMVSSLKAKMGGVDFFACLGI